jgi:hypothetical protein
MVAGNHGLQTGFETLPGWAEYWIRPKTTLVIEKGMYAAQVHGTAMAPLIPAGSYCVFRLPRKRSREGKVLIVRHSGIIDPAMGGNYTVRKWFSTHAEPGAFAKITLTALASDGSPIVLEPQREDEVEVLGEWVRTL